MTKRKRDFDCADCGINTIEINEFYMVENELWDSHGAGEGMLCVGCFEERLGRELRPSDFSRARCNWNWCDLDNHSERLSDRIGCNPPPENDEMLMRLRKIIRRAG